MESDERHDDDDGLELREDLEGHWTLWKDSRHALTPGYLLALYFPFSSSLPRFPIFPSSPLSFTITTALNILYEHPFI